MALEEGAEVGALEAVDDLALGGLEGQVDAHPEGGVGFHAGLDGDAQVGEVVGATFVVGRTPLRVQPVAEPLALPPSPDTRFGDLVGQLRAEAKTARNKVEAAEQTTQRKAIKDLSEAKTTEQLSSAIEALEELLGFASHDSSQGRQVRGREVSRRNDRRR